MKQVESNIGLIAFICHFLSLSLFLWVEYSFMEDFVRWRLDWGLYFLTIVSSIVFILKNKKGVASLIFKIYFTLYLLFAVFLGLIIQFDGYNPIVADSDCYTVHKLPGGWIDPGYYCLYKKEGLLEKKVKYLTDDGFSYQLKNFKVEGDSAVSFDLVCVVEEMCGLETIHEIFSIR